MDKQQYIEQLITSMSQLKKLLETHTGEFSENRAATLLQFSILKFLKKSKNCTVGDIAEYVGLSKSSATQLIERLVKAGFVERFHDQEDRRIVRVSTTSTGEAQLASMKKSYIEKMGKLFSRIPVSDLKELLRIHNELIETLHKEIK